MKGLPFKKGRPIGESWEVSDHPLLPSRVAGGMLLSQRLKKKLPFLVKFIDAQDNLSLQVHPPYKNSPTREAGKIEHWVILGGTGSIYLGLKKNRKNLKKDFLAAIRRGASMKNFLNRIHPRIGDVYRVPPGTIHAIGKGLHIYEIQQPSGVTYRLWDWDRSGPKRELHVDKAVRVMDFRPRSPAYYRLKRVHDREAGYTVDPIDLVGDKTIVTRHMRGTLTALTAWKGRARLFTKLKGEKNYQIDGIIAQGGTVVLPPSIVAYRLERLTSETRLLEAHAFS